MLSKIIYQLNKKRYFLQFDKINFSWTINLFSFFIFLIFINGCNKEEEIEDSFVPTKSNSINQILPLGASRVEGARPKYESFRYELWKDLTEAGFTFDFIGLYFDDANYPEKHNDLFDRNHQGNSGATTSDILNDIDDWSSLYTPDIVLFSSPGGNDALENLPLSNTIDNINYIIDEIQYINPNVTILIEQLAPAESSIMTDALSYYMSQLHQAVHLIAKKKSTQTSKIIAIDMFTNFSDQLLADDVHYNNLGASFIAQKYYDVLSLELKN